MPIFFFGFDFLGIFGYLVFFSEKSHTICSNLDVFAHFWPVLTFRQSGRTFFYLLKVALNGRLLDFVQDEHLLIYFSDKLFHLWHYKKRHLFSRRGHFREMYKQMRILKIMGKSL